jgi:transposase
VSMGPASPRKIHRYSLEFKRQAVKLSQLDGVEVQAVADALDIHPFMLSRWRKEMRDGQLRGTGGVAPVKPPKVREPGVQSLGLFKTQQGEKRVTSSSSFS